MAYTIEFHHSAAKFLLSIPEPYRGSITAKIKMLKADPRPPGAGKIKGSRKVEQVWRIRSGKYRVLYSQPDKNGTIRIYDIRHRKDIYRSINR